MVYCYIHISVLKMKRYAISDIVVDKDIKLPKYVQIFDIEGNLVTESEIYFIENE